MKLALWVLALIAGLGLLLTACGSGGESVDQDSEPASTGTVRSERADRQASIMQRQGQVAAEAERVPDQVGDGEQVDVSSDDGPVAGVTEVGAIDFGHREGLPFLRNSVGDPDAPVVIVEYSDFQ